MPATTRQPAVAGLFYPEDPQLLRQAVRRHLESARNSPPSGAAPPPAPRAIVAPHAGYVYSGPIAGSAYATIAHLRGEIQRVVLVGPSHRKAFHGMALPGVDAFVTPLGPVRLDRSEIAELTRVAGVMIDDEAHRREHSLEVHLPFLQELFGDFLLVPFSVGLARAESVAAVLERWADARDTLFVISSDLSHFHDYATARRIDAKTTKAIEALSHEVLAPELACGCYGLGGLLALARTHGWQASTLDVRNSGDTAGDHSRVVGYGAWAFAPPAGARDR